MHGNDHNNTGVQTLPIWFLKLVTFRQRATALLKDGPPLAIRFSARMDLSVTLCLPGSTATARASASIPFASPMSIRLADCPAMCARNSTAGWHTYSQVTSPSHSCSSVSISLHSAATTAGMASVRLGCSCLWRAMWANTQAAVSVTQGSAAP